MPLEENTQERTIMAEENSLQINAEEEEENAGVEVAVEEVEEEEDDDDAMSAEMVEAPEQPSQQKQSGNVPLPVVDLQALLARISPALRKSKTTPDESEISKPVVAGTMEDQHEVDQGNLEEEDEDEEEEEEEEADDDEDEEGEEYEPAEETDMPSTLTAPTKNAPAHQASASGNSLFESTEAEDEVYDEFLSYENAVVSEGKWDQFPSQSRMFIGNLPNERVSKREVWRVFCKYGKIAQISIKQAYGFVQFLSDEICALVISQEEGTEVAGRKIHLEVSKPQVNKPGKRERGSGGGGGGGGGMRPRSRSPRRRSRSPRRSYGREGRYRSRSPPPGWFGGNNRRVEFPLPRRFGQDVPDCQIIVTDEIDR